MKINYLLTWHDWSHELTAILGNADNLWIHIVAHVIFIITPVSFLFVMLFILFRLIYQLIMKKIKNRPENNNKSIEDIPKNVFQFIAQFSLKKQILLCIGSLIILPVTYASLELPKRIINQAIGSSDFLKENTALSIGQSDYLLFLCSLFLMVIIASAVIKYIVNFYRGVIAESLNKTLRQHIYKKYKERKNQDNNIIPVVTQEVEPIGGFSGESFSVPILQGGIALTIIVFMMMQNIALGIAAIALLPVQIMVIPYFQRIVNRYVRQRVLVVRQLSAAVNNEGEGNFEIVSGYFDLLQSLRLKIFKTKYLMKSTNNFLMNLTPFFFYTIGGYLVIRGELSLGALIASLASYKDMAASIRDLFAYYQRMQDVKIRYVEVCNYLHEQQLVSSQKTHALI